MEASFMQGQFQDGTESGFLRDAILLLTLVRLNSILREYLLSAHRWTQTTSCLWLLMWVCHEIPDYIIYILQLLYEYCICILYHIMNLHSHHGFPIFRDKSTIYMVSVFLVSLAICKGHVCITSTEHVSVPCVSFGRRRRTVPRRTKVACLQLFRKKLQRNV